MRKKIVQVAPAELPQEIWDVRRICAFLGISRARLYQLIDAGLPSRKIGGSRRFDPRDVAAWWEDRKESA